MNQEEATRKPKEKKASASFAMLQAGAARPGAQRTEKAAEKIHDHVNPPCTPRRFAPVPSSSSSSSSSSSRSSASTSERPRAPSAKPREEPNERTRRPPGSR